MSTRQYKTQKHNSYLQKAPTTLHTGISHTCNRFTLAVLWSVRHANFIKFNTLHAVNEIYSSWTPALLCMCLSAELWNKTDTASHLLTLKTIQLPSFCMCGLPHKTRTICFSYWSPQEWKRLTKFHFLNGRVCSEVQSSCGNNTKTVFITKRLLQKLTFPQLVRNSPLSMKL
jgi:hypothetical protein